MNQMQLKPIAEIDMLMNKSAVKIADLLVRIGMAWLKGVISPDAELRALTEIIRKSQGIADILGRKRSALELEKTALRDGTNELFFAEEQFNARNFSIKRALENKLENTVEDIVQSNRVLRRRDPTNLVIVTHNKQRLIPVVNNAATDVVNKVNQLLSSGVQDGKSLTDFGEIEDILREWAKGRSETIYRTNIAQAYTAGRFRSMVENPEITSRMPALMFSSVGDQNTRPMHDAFDGKIFLVNDPIWDILAPPIHYNCRCSIRAIPVRTLRQMGRIDKNNQFVPENIIPPLPIPNFGVRPDKTIYGVI